MLFKIKHEKVKSVNILVVTAHNDVLFFSGGLKMASSYTLYLNASCFNNPYICIISSHYSGLWEMNTVLISYSILCVFIVT